MKHRYTAALLAAFLLLGVCGCGSKPVTLNETAPSSAAEIPAESTAESAAPEISGTAGAETASDGAVISTETATAASAAAGSAPAHLSDGEPQAVAQEETVDPGKIAEPPAGADDDQIGELHEDPAATSMADKPAATAPTDPPKAASDSKLATRGGASAGKLQIGIQTVEVTPEQLKSNDYTVDLLVSLDKNPGITYSEWGLHLDKRCSYTADSDGLPIETIYSISDTEHFLWTAWTSGSNVTSKTGGMLTLHVKLPRDAKSGTSYPVTYADTSLQPAPHIWQSADNNWVISKQVSWVNGGVVVK